MPNDPIGLHENVRKLQKGACHWRIQRIFCFRILGRQNCISPQNVFVCVLLLQQWGTWKAGVSLVHTGIRHPKSVMKNVIPIVMAGVIGIYGLIVGVILAQGITKPTAARDNTYSIYTGMAHVSHSSSLSCWGSLRTGLHQDHLFAHNLLSPCCGYLSASLFQSSWLLVCVVVCRV